jgi:hypothetical protein
MSVKYSPVTLSRRHVLGDLYGRCDALKDQVPVYLDGAERQLLGHADEQLGTFSDAISFFLDDDVCKKLSSGQFTFSFDYDLAKGLGKDAGGRVVLTSITLIGRPGYAKPIARRR